MSFARRLPSSAAAPVTGLRVHHARAARVEREDGSHFLLEPRALAGGVSAFRVRSSGVREVRYRPGDALLVHAPLRRDDWSAPAVTRFAGGERRALAYRPGLIALTDATLEHTWSYGGCETLSLAVPIPGADGPWDEETTPERLRTALHGAMARPHADPLLRALVLHAWDAAAEPVPRLLADGAAALVLSAVLRLGGRPRPVRGSLAPWRLRRALDHMAAHLAEDVTLADVAAAAGVSVSHLQHAFRASTGESPHRWLVRRRIEGAQALLAETDQPIAAVALAVGFAGQSHFTTAFRRVTGTTPRAWREAAR